MYRNNERYTRSTCGTNLHLPFDVNVMFNLSIKIVFNYAIALPCSIISTRFRKCGKIAQPIRIAICWTILMPVWRACHDFLLRHTAFKKGSREGIPRADATTAKALWETKQCRKWWVVGQIWKTIWGWYPENWYYPSNQHYFDYGDNTFEKAG